MANKDKEFKKGDGVTIQTGEHAGKSAKIDKVLPTQATGLGREQRQMYQTDVGSEIYRVQDLKSS